MSWKLHSPWHHSIWESHLVWPYEQHEQGGNLNAICCISGSKDKDWWWWLSQGVGLIDKTCPGICMPIMACKIEWTPASRLVRISEYVNMFGICYKKNVFQKFLYHFGTCWIHLWIVSSWQITLNGPNMQIKFDSYFLLMQ